MVKRELSNHSGEVDPGERQCSVLEGREPLTTDELASVEALIARWRKSLSRKRGMDERALAKAYLIAAWEGCSVTVRSVRGGTTRSLVGRTRDALGRRLLARDVDVFGILRDFGASDFRSEEARVRVRTSAPLYAPDVRPGVPVGAATADLLGDIVREIEDLYELLGARKNGMRRELYQLPEGVSESEGMFDFLRHLVIAAQCVVWFRRAHWSEEGEALLEEVRRAVDEHLALARGGDGGSGEEAASGPRVAAVRVVADVIGVAESTVYRALESTSHENP